MDKEKNMSIKGKGLHLIHFFFSVFLLFAVFEQFYIKWYLGGFYMKRTFMILGIYSVILMFLLRAYDAYEVGIDTIPGLVFGQILSNFVADVLIYGAICLVFVRLVNPLPVLFLFALQILWDIVWSLYANKWYFDRNSHVKTLVLYRDEEKLEVIKDIKMSDIKYDVQKYINVESVDKNNLSFLKDFRIVFIVDLDEEMRNAILKECIYYGIRCMVMPHIGDVMLMGGRHLKNCYSPVYLVERSNPSVEYTIIKRSFDIIFSLLAIILLSPFMILTAISIFMEDHGPILYFQTRLTKDGKQFKIIKFRSMKVDAEKDGIARLAKNHDDRITKVGNIIRKYRIDEIPQLFNILMGDMSIVGPRPERPEIAAEYEKSLESFKARLQVKAGLTGYAQIYGKYNSSPYHKLMMDLMYINNMSILTDLKLMFATIKILFEKESTEGIDDNKTTAQ